MSTPERHHTETTFDLTESSKDTLRWVAILIDDLHPQAKFHINLTIRVAREDDAWVSECLELGLASCGGSIEAATDAAVDAALVYLNSLEAIGRRGEILRQREVDVHVGPPGKRERHVVEPPEPEEAFYSVRSAALVGAGA